MDPGTLELCRDVPQTHSDLQWLDLVRKVNQVQKVWNGVRKEYMEYSGILLYIHIYSLRGFQLNIQ